VVDHVVGSLFYDALSEPRLYRIDDRMISEWWWIGKELVGSGRDLNFRYYLGIRLEGPRKTTKNSIRIAGRRGPSIEPGTFRIRGMSVNHSTTAFAGIKYEKIRQQEQSLIHRPVRRRRHGQPSLNRLLDGFNVETKLGLWSEREGRNSTQGYQLSSD
jgi:hypothetical protein